MINKAMKYYYENSRNKAFTIKLYRKDLGIL